METQDPRELAEQIKDYLRGMKRVRADHLPRLADFDNWQELARREVERRATHIIQMLDDAQLAAIVAGKINVPAAIRDVMAEEGAQ